MTFVCDVIFAADYGDCMRFLKVTCVNKYEYMI